MAAAKNVGFAYGFNVHDEDATQHVRPDTDDIPEAGHLVRDVIYGSNFTASHLVHFYHLAALDFVDVANVGLGLNKGPFCPRYGPNPGDSTYPYYYRIPAGVSAYLTAQYVLALKVRRLCNQIGGLWGGRAPFIQGLTPGGCSPSVSQDAIDKTRELLYEGGVGGTATNPAPNTILKFIGTPFDFANYVSNCTVTDFSNLPIVGTITDAATQYAGTMMFDVVAAACFYPEYFWYGNAYERFLAYGVFEKGDPANAIGDSRLLSRGRKNTGAKYSNQTGVLPAAFSAAKPAEWQSVLHQDVYESVANSHYLYEGLGPNAWKQPLAGETTPEPRRTPTLASPAGYDAYSWIKSPRYKDMSDPLGPAVPYEAGPLARMMVNGDYYAGILKDLGACGYNSALPGSSPDGSTIPVGPFAGVPLPTYGDPGPDLQAIFPTGMGFFPNLGPGGYNLTYTGGSALDRYAARQIECWKVANALVGWLDRLQAQVGAVTSITRKPASQGGSDAYYSQSYGWTEAPRGALGHWMVTHQPSGKIQNYQCVVPSTWNASPRDALGTPGPAEKAMEDIFVKDVNHPLEVLRVSHSWDFCTACAVHLVKKDGSKVKEEKHFTMEPAPTGG